jgi:hypothetical protein
MRAPAADASSAALVAVACSVSSARWRSSSENVDSWTSRSASRAASRTDSAARVSPARTTFLPGRAGPSTCSGLTVVPSGSATVSPALQAPEERPLGHAEGLRPFEVEAPGPRFLDERISVRRHAVLHGERLDPVVVPADPVTRPELFQRELIAEPSEDASEDAEELVEPGRAVHGERHLAAPKRERLQHARQAEVVIGVVVRQKDLGQLDEPDRRAQELALRPLTAVEEDPLSAAA